MANDKCGHITAAHVKYVILHISGTLKYAQLRTFHYSEGLYSNSYVHSHCDCGISYYSNVVMPFIYTVHHGSLSGWIILF